MASPRALGLLVMLGACTPAFGDGPEAPARAAVCPGGYALDAAREARLLGLLTAAESDAGTLDLPRDLARRVAPVCFGPARSVGVLAGERVVLRAASSDEELAARLAHLAAHLEDGLGDGCARGLAAALASEARAWRVEDALRARFGLAPAPDERADAGRDYARRCAR